MDPRELLIWAGMPGFASVPLLVLWPVIVVVAIFVIVAVYVWVAMILVIITDLVWGDDPSAQRRVGHFLLDKPIDWIASGVEWPKRFVDRQRFYRTFGFKPWELENFQVIDELLSKAALSLYFAFVIEVSFQRTGTIGLTKAQRKFVMTSVARSKKRFWYLHALAQRVARYPDCSGCSYRDHLSKDHLSRCARALTRTL